MIDIHPRETFKKNYIEKNGLNGWIKYTGHYLEFPEGYTLNSVVEFLIKLRKVGFNSYYTTFNGVDLFVRDVTLESAFLILHNINKSEMIEFLSQSGKSLEEICEDNKHKLIKKM